MPHQGLRKINALILGRRRQEGHAAIARKAMAGNGVSWATFEVRWHSHPMDK